MIFATFSGHITVNNIYKCDLPREKGPNAEKIDFLFLILIEKSFFPLSNGGF